MLQSVHPGSHPTSSDITALLIAFGHFLWRSHDPNHRTTYSGSMGIPYSKQINAAFEQVTPLVAEGFEVLQTTRNITLLLAEIQVLTVVLLGFILMAIVMLLVTMNPELERERKALITPFLRWICSWFMTGAGKVRYGIMVVMLVLVVPGIIYAHWWFYFNRKDAEIVPAGNVDSTEADEVGKPDSGTTTEKKDAKSAE